MRPSFAMRSHDTEIMDDLQYAGTMMDQTLRELEIINRWLGGNAVTLNALSRTVARTTRQPLEIADLGCGRGDMLRHIKQWAARKKLDVSLTGIDANPYVIEAARRNVADSRIDFKTIDILSEEFAALQYDIVTGTLFYHHFSDAQLVSFFSSLRERCRVGFIINDIHRHPVAYYAIKALTQLFSRSNMVKYDAPLSVLRAFRKKELEDVLLQAGCTKYELRWRWAFRWQICVFTS